jgi:tRNA(Ile)-lysidine synthase
LAHTQDDVAETVLMRLIRGSGLYGLRSILPKREIEGQIFIRPLLGCSRRDIEVYLKSKRVGFCHDQSNDKAVFLRNKIRLNFLPALKTYNPNIAQGLSDLAETVTQDYDLLHAHLQKRFKESVVRQVGKARIRLDAIAKEHLSMRRLILRAMNDSLVGQEGGLTFDHMRELENLLDARPTGSVVHLPMNVHVKKTRTHLEFAL